MSNTWSCASGSVADLVDLEPGQNLEGREDGSLVEDGSLIEDLEEDAQSGSLATHVWGSTHALRSTCFSGLVRSGPPFSAGLNCRFSLASGDDWSLEDLQSLKRIPSSDPPRNWSSQEVLHSSY